MAIYSSNHPDNSSHLRELMQERLDLLFPNTIPASRRSNKVNQKTLDYIEKQQEEKQKKIYEKSKNTKK